MWQWPASHHMTVIWVIPPVCAHQYVDSEAQMYSLLSYRIGKGSDASTTSNLESMCLHWHSDKPPTLTPLLQMPVKPKSHPRGHPRKKQRMKKRAQMNRLRPHVQDHLTASLQAMLVGRWQNWWYISKDHTRELVSTQCYLLRLFWIQINPQKGM